MRRTVLLLERPEWSKVRARVDEMIARGYTFTEILAEVNGSGKAPSKLHLSTLQRYNQQRYSRQARMFEAARMQAEAALEVLRQHGEPQAGELIRMNLVEAFLANQHKLADADPVKLGWLQVQYESIAQQREQLAHQKRELEAKLAEREEKAARERKAIDGAAAAGTLDAETIRRIRQEVYGIVDAA